MRLALCLYFVSLCVFGEDWTGRRVAFLGVGAAEADVVGVSGICRDFFREGLAVTPFDYTAQGAVMADVAVQAVRLKAEHPNDLDALFIFAGTNDFRVGTRPGTWYTVALTAVNRNGAQTTLQRRQFVMDGETYRGQISAAMTYLKENFPDKPVYFVTPRLDADATVTNGLGRLAGDYAQAVREAGNVWSVSVVDLAAEAPVSGEDGTELFRTPASATNRVPISSAVSLARCALDSRTVLSADSNVIAFNSDEARDIIILIR